MNIDAAEVRRWVEFWEEKGGEANIDRFFIFRAKERIRKGISFFLFFSGKKDGIHDRFSRIEEFKEL